MILTSCFCTCCTKIGSRDFPFACKLWHQNLFSLEYRVIHGPREMERVVWCCVGKGKGKEMVVRFLFSLGIGMEKTKLKL